MKTGSRGNKIARSSRRDYKILNRFNRLALIKNRLERRRQRIISRNELTDLARYNILLQIDNNIKVIEELLNFRPDGYSFPIASEDYNISAYSKLPSAIRAKVSSRKYLENMPPPDAFVVKRDHKPTLVQTK